MARKGKGFVFLLFGCILLAIAGGWFVYNIAEDKSAGQKATEILDRFEDEQSDLDTNSESAPVITVGDDAFCGRIIIDCLGIELPVYDEWNYSRLKSAPCRYIGGIDSNDIIIAAHNYKSHFGNLKKLQIGDRIAFIDASGKTHNYEVCETVALDGTAVSDMQSGGWDLTLFTCTKGGEQRVTVRCKRIN